MEKFFDSFKNLSVQLPTSLEGDAELQLSLDGESTDYVRWNRALVRQNTTVNQAYLKLLLKKNKRSVTVKGPLTGQQSEDESFWRLKLVSLQGQIQNWPEDPHPPEIENHGSLTTQVSVAARAQMPKTVDLISVIGEITKGLDFVAILANGISFVGSANSKGQFHWFESAWTTLDYSLYNGPAAAKGVYFSKNFSPIELAEKLEHSKKELQVLSKPKRVLKPGSYRVFLEAGAVASILEVMSYRSLSYKAYCSGQSPWQDLATGENSLSPQISLRENFTSELVPRFNSWGEIAPEQVDLFEKGKLKQFLINTKSEKEFGVKSNMANEEEYPRCLEMDGGNLDSSEVLAKLERGLYLTQLHYLNWSDQKSARVTGMTRFGAIWVEDGKWSEPIEDMRFDVSLYKAWGNNLLGVTKETVMDPMVLSYFQRDMGGRRVPGLLIDDFSFKN